MTREAAEQHLTTLLGAPEFARAGAQARALAAMVRAALEGRVPTGAELSIEVYGRSDERYVRALRQLIREIRLKLPGAYDGLAPASIRFELPESGYEIAIVPTVGGVPVTDPGPGELAAAVGRRRRTLVAGAVVALLVVVAAAWAVRGREPAESLPAAVSVRGGQVVVRDASGAELPEWGAWLTAELGFPACCPSPTPADWARFVVLEAEGRRPLVAFLLTRRDSPVGTRLVLLDGRTREELSRLRLPVFTQAASASPEASAATAMPASIDVIPDGTVPAAFVGADLAAAEFDGDGRRDELVVSVMHQDLFPDQVLLLDPERGWARLGEFWSMGRAWVLVVPDGDGDGADEVFVYGHRNAEQRGFFTLLPSPRGSRGFRGRTPDGRRAVTLRDAADLPPAGLTVEFPVTELADPRFPEHYGLRAYVHTAAWDPALRRLSFTVRDAMRDPKSGDAQELQFHVAVAPPRVTVRIINYDIYLRELLTAVASGRLQDRWGIRTTESLTAYADDLAARTVAFDADAPSPRWRPFDPAVVARRLERSAPAVPAATVP